MAAPCQTSGTRFFSDISAFSVGVPTVQMLVYYTSQLRMCPAKHIQVGMCTHRRHSSASASNSKKLILKKKSADGQKHEKELRIYPVNFLTTEQQTKKVGCLLEKN